MRVSLVATGGTIASRATGRGVLAQVDAATLLSSVPKTGVPEGALVTPVDAGTRGSFALTLDDMRAVATDVLAQIDGGADGVVVLHGTDSMEETAFLVDLSYDGDCPIVFTGAQRPFDAPDRDGPDNIADALRRAVGERTRGTGVLVAFGGRTWPARGVRKTHTTALDAFSADSGEVGHGTSAAGRPRSFVTGARSALRSGPVPRVDVVALVPGGDGSAIRAACKAGSAGVVVQSVGIGNAGPQDTRAVADAVSDDVPVLVTTRVPHGPVRPVYGGGGGADLLQAGAVFCGSLSPWQARVLLATALTVAPDDPVSLVRDWLTRTDLN